ncbi:MAG TPA: acyltransferase [Patescibacteria group bacterium]|nr:acyltransferase [Patescibacteria group bacterium]
MKIFNNIDKAIETPWKLYNEVAMYLARPFVDLYLFVNGVSIASGGKFYGFPKIFKHLGSKINIGKNFECRNWWFSNPLGLNHPTIICTWSATARIIIGNDVGISGGSIVASNKIEIGDGTIVGANCTIIDTDFHPIKSAFRRYDKKRIKSMPVKIGKNVFVGMNCIILKGATIPDNAVVPAGSVIRSR